jgi:abequosyltransferase
MFISEDVVNRAGSAIDVPQLSICVPVYNFGAFLGETLNSIVPQLTSGIEVLVLDGASTDNTPQIMEQQVSRCSQLRYVRLDKRGGIDADLATCVELARGKYCWLFSGDDLMRAGALQHALDSLRTNHDVYVCKHTICDKNMQIIRQYPIFRDDCSRTVELSNIIERTAMLRMGLNTEALFSFMSSLIVRRDKWRSVEPDAKFMGGCWGHVARLLAIAQHQLAVSYLSDVWLDKRGENDSFMEHGVVNRFRVAVDGFVGIITHYYGENSVERNEVLRFLRRELSLLSFFYARDRALESPNFENRSELDRIFGICYGDRGFRNWLARVLYHYLPIVWYRGLKLAYKMARAPWRWAHQTLKWQRHV